ncbi:class I SAM-dependent methyltransferase [Kribbella speibonae]|uniref:Class I SAM-dependent methyltransferase n=1 Tax=Kribbella speibonae TaxID=1572660 RepID=A0A4R0J9N0_9ACTN|nr:class I SAM-dependent methyltransferase [Kribbella speibonae]TCC42044.1 class I SAM-dependent methyltransferase [Kribbella speibonae]
MDAAGGYDEAELFGGLAAEQWAVASRADPRRDAPFYREIIRTQGGPALELGCGSGRLLLTYLAEGLDVSGCDISRDMLAACRQEAARLGLDPTLYEQSMQDLAVPGTFRTIYIPCGSFACVMDRQEALQTLQRCHAQLDLGGVLAFNVFPVGINYAEPPGDDFPTPWERAIQVDLPNGNRLEVSSRWTALDRVEQSWQEERRYDEYAGSDLLRTETRSGQGRWYFRNELLWMLQLAGFAPGDVTVTGDFTPAQFGPRHGYTMVITAFRR